MKTLHLGTLATWLDHGIDVGFVLDDLLYYCRGAGTFAPLDDIAAYLEDGGMQSAIDTSLNSRDKFSEYYVMASLLGLTHMEEHVSIPPFSSYAKASQEERYAQRAIVEVTYKLGGKFDYRKRVNSFEVRVLSSYQLLDYIRSHPEKVEQVVKVIKDRGVTPDVAGDVASLMETMDEVTNPLLDGAL